MSADLFFYFFVCGEFKNEKNGFSAVFLISDQPKKPKNMMIARTIEMRETAAIAFILLSDFCLKPLTLV